jgi:hypothetical protein
MERGGIVTKSGAVKRANEATATSAVPTRARNRQQPSHDDRDADASLGTNVWTNRIVGHGDVSPSELVANSRNWRLHPEAQRAALAGALSEVGWVAQLIVNKRTGQLVDGHARAELARARNEPTVPVVYVDLSAEEEAVVLATLDPIAAMATTDPAKLDELLRGITVSDDALHAMLEDMAVATDKLLGDADQTRRAFTDEQVVDAAFAHLRQTGFPYRKLPLHVCMQEINALAKLDTGELTNTHLAHQVADTFHPHRFHAKVGTKPSPFEAFHDDTRLRLALSLQLAQLGSIPEGYFSTLGLVRGTQACANFRPGYALHHYRRFAKPGGVVLDSSTGFGGRLVAFFASELSRYIGIDPSTKTHAANVAMGEAFGCSERIELHNLPAEDVPHERLRGRCDVAVTSPPYFSKEHYADEETQSFKRYATGEAWRAGFLVPMLALQYIALRPGSHAVINIADVTINQTLYPLVDWTVAAARATGFEHVATEMLALGHRFGQNHPAEGVAEEPVLIFRKPGAR